MIKSFLQIQGKKMRQVVIINCGFTIIELMVVCAIVIIISVYVSANYHRGDRELGLELTAGQMVQNFRRVQEWAYSAHQFNNESYAGYGIYIERGNSYIIYTDGGPEGADVNGYYDSGDKVRETVSFTKDLEIDNIKPCGPDDTCDDADGLSIDFIPPDPGTIIRDGDGNEYDTATIILHADKISGDRSIVINRAGLIYAQ